MPIELVPCISSITVEVHGGGKAGISFMQGVSESHLFQGRNEDNCQPHHSDPS